MKLRLNIKNLENGLFVLSFLVLALSNIAFANSDSVENKEKLSSELSYRTQLGKCPTKPAGTMALQVVKTFDEKRSLRDVKLKILEEKWQEKYFISDYKISYNPFSKLLNLELNCPEPLMRVQVYKKDSSEYYEAILVDNGELYDPTYEALLRSDKKLIGELPFFSMPVGEMEKKIQDNMTSLFKEIRPSLRKKLSEVILTEGKELTIILSANGKPTSVFLGLEDWNEKLNKLDKIVSYMETREKIPTIINLTNNKKVVVKFNDKL